MNFRHPDNAGKSAAHKVLSPGALTARVIAVLVSRRTNAAIYALRGCEELDSGYRTLEKILAGVRIRTTAADEPEKLYNDLLGKVESNAQFAAKLNAWASSNFPSKFGQLATLVLNNWDQLPEMQRDLAEGGERWIVAAMASWPAGFRETMHAEMLHTARRLYLFTNLWHLRRMARLLDRANALPPGFRLDEVRDFPGMAFSAVLDEEMEEIEIRRGTGTGAATDAGTAGLPQQRADMADLAGLAFSGGGVRSATFNLGVLQFLAESGLLRRFDYLSTVSGGGYIGSWLHAWIHASDQHDKDEPEKASKGIDRVEECLSPSRVSDPQDERAGPIRFLRRYSNYLTPQIGAMSADTWTMLNIWLRNTFLNVLILALALSAILLVPRWLAAANRLDDRAITDHWWVLMILPACLIGINLATFHRQLKLQWVRARLCKEQAVLLSIVVPIFVAAWGAGTYVSKDLLQHPDRANRIILDDAFQFAWVTALLVLLVSVMGRLDLNFYREGRRGLQWLRTILAYFWILGVCLTAALASGAFYYFWLAEVVAPLWGINLEPVASLVPRRLDPHTVNEILTGSAPAFLFLLSIAMFLYMGLLGRRFADDRREWVARLGAWLTICCIGWVALCGTATYGPGFMDWLVSKVGEYVGTGLDAMLILAAAAGVFAGRASAKNASASVAGVPARLIAKVAPPVFVVGLLLLLSHALDKLFRLADGWTGWAAFSLSAIGGLLALFLSRRVDINEFSLHQFYRNRLVRCYLGGARAGRRRPDPFTGFDADDDFPVSALAPSKGYSGPYPIFNATLNVSHGDELAWQERQGEAFVFTPMFSGFDVGHGRATHPRTEGEPKLSYGGYRPTADYAFPERGGVSVGTAVAMSGAAASPNQGTQTSASTAFLMTVLDVRLGWWLGNPRRTDTWQRPGPTTGLFQLLAELTGSTNDTGKYVNLSDGGHFENLAIYELIRRRCRYIVACDAEEDHNYAFGGLGNVIRKCRTDFGVEIEIDATGLKPGKDSRFAREHFVLGTIHYPRDASGAAAQGTLIYIKSSLCGRESADVLQYSLQSPQFPHESTADQWFDETQFESYRKLGYHAAEGAGSIFGDLGIHPVPISLKAAATKAG